jgi:alpha-glucoside transport system permease protein
MTKVLTTILSVVIAVGVFTALWVGLNLIFNQATRDFKRFSALAGGVLGLVLMTVIDGNRLITGIGVRPDTFEWSALHIYLFWPIVGAVIGAAIGWFLSTLDDANMRLGFGIAAGLGVGLLIAFLLKGRYQLAMRTTPLILWPLIMGSVGVGLNLLRRRNLIKGALTGLFFGWLYGSFGGAIQGVDQANLPETLLAGGVAGALGGARLGLTSNPDIVGRAEIDQRSRSWIFVGPAFLFYSAMLILPTIQTFLLSLKNRDSTEWVLGDNYASVFSDPNNFDTSSFGDIFGSSILPWVAFYLVAGLAIAFLLGRETAQPLNFGGAPILPLGIAAALFSFALFSYLRGTIINNLWWVVGVTLLSTSLGLAIAKLADGVRGESVAKSFVFMPMAISMVGASIIWRLMMYQARDTSKSQTGVFNAVWVWLGDFSTSQPGKTIVGLIFLALVAALTYFAYRSLAKSPSVAALYLVLAAIPLWVAYRTFSEGIGGYTIRDDGTFAAQTVNFVQSPPFNNFYLMMIMIWIQTGFAMVILSAAIKAVPEDFLEAAKIDGATEGQIFWRITVPQVMPTILVVATTIMVNVMKVFDFVKVTTNGQFGTQVLANAMFQEAFLNTNRGLGAALAIVLFAGVLPVMIWNVNNLLKEG